MSTVLTDHSADKINLLNFDQAGLRDFFTALDEKPFRATQLISWIHQYGQTDFSAMTNLSKRLRAKLMDMATISLPEIVVDQQSRDGTRKWLLQLPSQVISKRQAQFNVQASAPPEMVNPYAQVPNSIEMVYIPEANRGTLCISSQVGCSLNCTFCSTARQGFNRNLTTAEIIGQVWLAKKLLGETGRADQKITNIVFMGMGEPLHNLKAVLPTANLLMDSNAYNLSRRRVTLSTSGVVPNMDKLKAASEISLAVSLHAPNDELRNQLVPLNQKYPIHELLDACWRYVDAGQKRYVTFEYVMLNDVNDHPSHARQLKQLMQHRPAKVNLIPFNAFPGAGFTGSTRNQIERFSTILRDAGIVTTVRKTRGEDIDAACGQLVGQVDDKTRRQPFEQPVLYRPAR